jgi:uncharacterized cupin superfamily protein
MAQQTVEILRQGVREAKLDPFPLDPSQIVEGDPQASATILWKSEDGKQCNGIWECTPGVFDYVHTDETACLVQGRVTVTPEGGEPVEIGAGDIVFFPEGSRTRWHVRETVRKAFHLHASRGLGF